MKRLTEKQAKLNIQLMNVNDLIPANYNPRKDLKETDIEYQRIKNSILEFDYVDPLVFNLKTKTLISGHQRIKVLKELGYTDIEVNCVEFDEVKEKMLNIALNKVQGDWNDENLIELLNELTALDEDLLLLGFSEKELKKMFDEPKKSESAEIEFTQELLEEHNYVVLFFDNVTDWMTACDKLNIRSVKALNHKEDYKRQGIGRVLSGAEVLKRIND